MPGLYVVGQTWPRPDGEDGVLDAIAPFALERDRRSRLKRRWDRYRRQPRVVADADIVDPHRGAAIEDVRIHPTVVPNWDNTPRSGPRGLVYLGSDPDRYRARLSRTVSAISAKPPDQRLIYLKSWNEWAEGNYLEPDQRFGEGWLQATAAVLLGDVDVRGEPMQQ